MSNNNENQLIPRLRFPEFQHGGEWEVKKLGEVANVYQPKTISQTELKESGFPVYGANGVIGYFDQYNHETSQIAIACRGSSCGTVNFTKPKSWITGNAMVVNVDEFEAVSKIFLYYQLTGSNFSYLITGSGQPQITGTIRYHKIFLPSLPEQQKIAACLSSLDEVIAGERQKLALLQQHKKGLLQQLFPQEGETVPTLRFKEFEDSGEWEVKKLGEVAEINPSSTELPDEFVYIDLESVENGILLQRKIIKKEDSPSRAQRLLNENDIIFQMVRPYQKNNYFFKKNDNYFYVASTGYAQLRAFGSSMYLYQFIHTERFVSKVLEKCSGSNYPAINSSDLSKITVSIPIQDEQQKIASCLSSLDDIITAQTQKIELLEQHKKGLLQGLFPNVNDHG
jgi:type I restriction enzyme S subunit